MQTPERHSAHEDVKMKYPVNRSSQEEIIICAVYQGAVGLSVIMSMQSTYAWRCAFCARAIIRKKHPCV